MSGTWYLIPPPPVYHLFTLYTTYLPYLPTIFADAVKSKRSYSLNNNGLQYPWVDQAFNLKITPLQYTPLQYTSLQPLQYTITVVHHYITVHTITVHHYSTPLQYTLQYTITVHTITVHHYLQYTSLQYTITVHHYSTPLQYTTLQYTITVHDITVLHYSARHYSTIKLIARPSVGLCLINFSNSSIFRNAAFNTWLYRYSNWRW